MSNRSPDKKSKEELKDYAYLNTPLSDLFKSEFFPTEKGIPPALLGVQKDEAGNIIGVPAFLVDPATGNAITITQGAPAGFSNTQFLITTEAIIVGQKAVPAADSIVMDVWRNCGTKTQTSAVNAANSITIQILNLTEMLAIDMQASAGTATLQVSGSIDNVTYIDLEAPIAAALRIDKIYFAGTGTVGATIALSPLAFPFIKIVAGAAGVGNTTTLIVSVK